MSSGPLSRGDRGLRRFAASALDGHVAAIDPDLDPDPAVRGVGVDLAVADVGAKRAERDPTFAIPLATAHLGAAEPTGDRDADALRTGLHRPLHRLLDRLLVGDATAQLLGDVGGDQVRVELGLADLLDLELDLALGEVADLL